MSSASSSPLSSADAAAAVEAAQLLDLRGLKCPLPVLKARRAIKMMEQGAVLEVLADDPAALLDFAHFAETGGHCLLSSEKLPAEDGTAPVLRFLLRKGAGAQ